MCSATRAVTLRLPMDLAAAGRARAFLARVHCREHAARVLDRAQLAVTELVTNAVRYGAPPITTEIACCGEHGMRVRVSDGDPRAPVLCSVGTSAEGGRGMALVDLLCEEWGVEPAEIGKAVWFRIAA